MDIKASVVPDEWKNKTAQLRRKGRDTRWKFTKVKVAEGGKPQQRDIATPPSATEPRLD